MTVVPYQTLAQQLEMRWTTLIGAVVAFLVISNEFGSVSGSARSLFGAVEQVSSSHLVVLKHNPNLDNLCM